jgi:hypothetical protein
VVRLNVERSSLVSVGGFDVERSLLLVANDPAVDVDVLPTLVEHGIGYAAKAAGAVGSLYLEIPTLSSTALATRPQLPVPWVLCI